MELIERIGAFLGLAAFLGLGVLVLLYFQQGREVRRLRDWAGRAPERAAAAAAEAEAALSGANGEPEGGPTLRERARSRWEGWTKRLPTGMGERLPAPRWLGLIALAAVAIGIGVATGGFGLLGDDEPTKARKGRPAAPKIEVAVLNSTGVTGLANQVAGEVKKLDYNVGAVADVATPLGETAVMFDEGNEDAADQVADDVSDQLGKTSVQKMTSEVAEQANGAPVAIVIGQDDAQL